MAVVMINDGSAKLSHVFETAVRLESVIYLIALRLLGTTDIFNVQFLVLVLMDGSLPNACHCFQNKS